jgi:hypothetical protein
VLRWLGRRAYGGLAGADSRRLGQGRVGVRVARAARASGGGRRQEAHGRGRRGRPALWRGVAAQGALPRFKFASALFESNLLQNF